MYSPRPFHREVLGIVPGKISSYILFPGLTPDLCITCESSKI